MLLYIYMSIYTGGSFIGNLMMCFLFWHNVNRVCHYYDITVNTEYCAGMAINQLELVITGYKRDYTFSKWGFVRTYNWYFGPQLWGETVPQTTHKNGNGKLPPI